ncbi:MAG: caspase family protein [Planctomycetota bacterium]
MPYLNNDFRLMKSIITTLCLLAVSVTTATAADPPQKIALLVGISDYFHKNMEDLSFAENDVEMVGKELKQLGFDANVVTGKEATRERVENALDELLSKAAKMESDGIVFLMFSGHGQQLKARGPSGQGEESPFFCPRDAIPFDDRYHSLRNKTTEDLAEEFNLVSLNRVITQLDQRSNSQQNLLVVDACRNNPAKGKSTGITGRTALNPPLGMSVLFAAKSGQKSWESSDSKVQNGVMSHYLLKGLRGEARNRRGQMTWLRLVTYVREEVQFDQGRLAGGSDRAQSPHAISNNYGAIVLGESVFRGLEPANLVQDPFNLSQSTRIEADKKYVIQFWPKIDQQTKEDLESYRYDLINKLTAEQQTRCLILFEDTSENVKELLDSEFSIISEESIGSTMKEIAFGADPESLVANAYFRREAGDQSPHVFEFTSYGSETFGGKISDYRFRHAMDAAQKDIEKRTGWIGKPAPSFNVTHWHTDGRGAFEHRTDYRDGEITVVEIWATWCVPCISVMPGLAKLQRKHRDDGVRIISVSNEEPEDIEAFLDRPIVLPEGDENAGKTFREVYSDFSVVGDTTSDTWDHFMDDMGISAFPHAVIVDRAGNVAWMGHSSYLEETLSDVINGDFDKQAFDKLLLNNAVNESLTGCLEYIKSDEMFEDWLAVAHAYINEINAIDTKFDLSNRLNESSSSWVATFEEIAPLR